MKAADATAEVFVTAFESLHRSEREAVLKRLFADPTLKNDLLDVARWLQRRGERAIMEAGTKDKQNIILHEVTKLGCKDSGEPKKGANFYCDVEVDITTPSSGRQKENLAIEISQGIKERWVLTNVRKKISEFRGRYSDAMGTTTILFESGGDASLFRKEGGSYPGKYEIDGRKVKIVNRAGETLIILNMYDDGTLWIDTKEGRNVFKKL